MVHVPAGTFQRDATPANTSYVSAFYMSSYEITREQFKEIMEFDPSSTSISTTTDCPVQMVNWYHAIAFCNRLSIREDREPVYTINGSTDPDDWGSVPIVADATWDAAICDMNADGYRLATEMEWRWAAMGATKDCISGDIVGGINILGYAKSYSGSTESGSCIVNIANYAWNSSNSGSINHPVGTKYPNELGLYDMSGSVWEWCWDWNDGNPTGFPAGHLSNYTGVAGTSRRTFLGASYAEPFSSVSFQLFDRQYISRFPTDFADAVGFRVVRSAGENY